jgi:hypothetical protein
MIEVCFLFIQDSTFFTPESMKKQFADYKRSQAILKRKYCNYIITRQRTDRKRQYAGSAGNIAKKTYDY